jgi:hypothetical protein
LIENCHARRTNGRIRRKHTKTTRPLGAGYFTPWLALEENIAVLANAIGMEELEVEDQEAHVGRFRADIVCKDTTSGGWVLIENQLEPTDHKHLGQLMTYAGPGRLA